MAEVKITAMVEIRFYPVINRLHRKKDNAVMVAEQQHSNICCLKMNKKIKTVLKREV